MKIAFVISVCNAVSGHSNGVVSQALSWAEGLRARGHEVVLVDPWDDQNWRSFDILQFFGISTDIKYLYQGVKKKCDAPCVFAPIIDTERPWFMSRLAGKIAFPALHLASPWGDMLDIACGKSHFLARSDYELQYIRRALKVAENRIYKVPLNFRSLPEIAAGTEKKREGYCLHVSLLSAPRKNVVRLIKAALKYDFKLVLAGNVGDPKFGEYLNGIIDDHSNIVYLGRVDDNKLIELYSEATCFALPSLFEGVGLVALEAAAHGCGIVITDRGAPKEYYGGLAQLVDPESVDDIGKAVSRVLAGETHQPELGKHIKGHYSLTRIAEILEKAYVDIVGA